MTVAEFKHEFQECGKAIQCESKEHRAELLNYIEEIGMPIGESTRQLANVQLDGDVDFFFSCLIWYKPLGCVSACATTMSEIQRNGFIDDEKVAALLNSEAITAPAMTEEEFDEEFAKLIGA